MALMEWNNNLDIGVNDMNDQHKIILNYMNSLYDSVQNKEDFSKGKVFLDKLKDYTIQHFQEEEQYMESINFPGLESHKLIHKDLLNKFTKHYQEMIDAQQFSDSFFNFLKFWLSSHIQGIDIKYGNHANS